MEFTPTHRFYLVLAEDVVAREVLRLYVARLQVLVGAEGDDEVDLFRDGSLDVVGLVVGAVAGEDLAAGEGGLACLVGLADGVHHLDAVLVIGIHDGGDVEVRLVVEALEGNLGEHAPAGVVVAFRDGIGVADPALGELDRGLAVAFDLDRVNLCASLGGGDDDLAGGVILVLESHGVGAGQSGGGQSESRKLRNEMHLGKLLVDKGYRDRKCQTDGSTTVEIVLKLTR